MSADSFIVYYGAKYIVAPNEIDGVEHLTDSRIVAAKKVGLKCYYGSFSDVSTEWVLYIGAEIGNFGTEGKLYKSISMSDLEELESKVKNKMAEARLECECSLHFQVQLDY